MDKFRDVLDDLLDRPIAFNPAFKRITGSTVAALMLSQAWYWSKRTSDKDGWFYKKQGDWETETGLTRYEQETARKHLIEKGIMEEELHGVPATLFFRIKRDKIYELLGVQFVETPQTGLQKYPPPVGDDSTNIKDTEITHGIQPENTNKRILSPEEIEKITQKEKQREINELKNSRRKTNWPGRSDMPECITELLDVFYELTAIKPSKSMRSLWLKAANEWLELGIIPEDIRNAFEIAKSEKYGFLINGPSSLTKTANACAGQRRLGLSGKPIPESKNKNTKPNNFLERLANA